MSKNMTPSTKPMTDGQIEKVLSKLRSVFQKRADEYDSGQVQKALEHPSDLEIKMLSAFRAEVEIVSGLFTRKVRIDRTLHPHQLLKETECQGVYLEAEVFHSMPRAEEGVEEIEIVFFEIDGWWQAIDYRFEAIAQEYEKRGLKPVDPYTLAKANRGNTVREQLIHVNHETFWRDAEGHWCVMAFHHSSVRYHSVMVKKSEKGIFTTGWFAGVRK